VLINVSTAAIHNFKTAPLPNYSLAKNAQTLLLQLVADETSPEEMQIVSFHPGAILSEAAEKYGLTKDSLAWDNGKQPSQVIFVHLVGGMGYR
jgi:NAD(P)-dependent dehydrogenase (short-subunit alcohol dehydrogenase family)